MLREVSFYRLSVFVEVVECHGFRAASQKLNISQPAVSAHIRALEEQLGIHLFERNREIRLTEAGEVINKYARGVLKEADTVSQIINEMRNANSGQIAIGSSFLVRSVVSKLISKFKKNNPQVEVIFRTNNSQIINQLVIDREIDFGVVNDQTFIQDIITQTLAVDELVLVVGKTHPLYGKHNVAPELISEHSFLIALKETVFYKQLEKMLAIRGINIKKRAMQFDDHFNLRTMIIEGIGIGVMSKMTVAEDIQSGLMHRINLTGEPMMFKIYLIKRKDKYFSPVAYKFLKFFIHEVKELYS